MKSRVGAIVFSIALSVQLAVIFAVHDGDPSGPFLVGSGSASAFESASVPVATSQDSPGYDGQFFLALALDPLLRTELVYALDDVGYRARRILWSMASAAIGMGRFDFVVLALYLLSAGFLAAGSSAIACAAERSGHSPYWGILFALSLGSVVCLSRMLADAIMASLLLVALTMTTSRSIRLQTASGLVLALAVLQKETAALAAFPLLYLTLNNRAKGRLPVLTLAGLMVGCWWYYVARNSEPSGAKFLAINFGYPAAGLLESAIESLSADKAFLSKAKDVSFLAIHAALILLGLFRGYQSIRPFLRGRGGSPVGPSLLLFASMATFLSSAVWAEPWSYSRTLLPISGLLLLHEFESGAACSSTSRRRFHFSIVEGLVIAAAVAGIAFLGKNLLTGTP